jgi:hypothetical protein
MVVTCRCAPDKIELLCRLLRVPMRQFSYLTWSRDYTGKVYWHS